MPDISMCATETCPLASQCYRSPSSGTIPTEYRQSWQEFLPSFVVVGGAKVAFCGDFWPVPSPANVNVAQERAHA